MSFLYLILLLIPIGVAFRYCVELTQAARLVGRAIASPAYLSINKNGFQGAVTPPGSNKWFFLSMALLIGVVGCLWLSFGWTDALIGVVVAFLSGTVAQVTFLPKQDSRHFALRIFGSMARRVADYERDGDAARARAMKELLDKFAAQYGGMIAKDPTSEREDQMTLGGRLVAGIVAFVSALGFAAGHAQQRTNPKIEILSKADAVRLFGMTKQQWLDNVNGAVAARAAIRPPGDPRMPKMAMTTPEGDILITGVDYSKGDLKPAFIQVTVAYRATRRPRITAETLAGVIEEAQRQMAPEFEIHGSVDPMEGGVGVFFHIFDRRQ
jgi:hypothetical protein